MNWEAIGAVGEVLGALGVIATLGYLAFQIRQNTQSLHTESYARTLERAAAVQSKLSGDPILASILRRGGLDLRTLTPDERIQFNWTFYEMFGAFEFLFHQAKKGSLEDEIWARWSATMSWWLSIPGVESWWHAKPTPFTASFSSCVESILAGSSVDSDGVQRFLELVEKGS